MVLNKNHSQISKFFKNPTGNILIIEINEDISQFYLDLFRYYAHENKIEISIIKGELKNENVDLFSTKKINIQYLINKNKIDAASNETSNIIFTDYRNYKLFNQKFIAINSYDYLKDISNLILTKFQIQDDDFIAYCNDQPAMTFSELSKYSINKDNYLQNSQNNQNDNPISFFRKKFYNEKKNNSDIQQLYKILKDEVLVKRFNFLTY
jgi:hypothetical protein